MWMVWSTNLPPSFLIPVIFSFMSLITIYQVINVVICLLQTILLEYRLHQGLVLFVTDPLSLEEYLAYSRHAMIT